MSLYFRSRKYKTLIDCSFIAKDGPEYFNLSGLMVGDSVSITFDVSEDKAKAINDMEGMFGLNANNPFSVQEQWTVNIPFKVTERKHYFGWKDIGVLRAGMTQVYLEAENGHWEDVFLWVCLNERPIWVDEPDEPAAEQATAGELKG